MDMSSVVCGIALLILVVLPILSTAEILFTSNLVSEQVEISQIPRRNLSSDAWRPLIITQCIPGLHNESAPCRRVPNLIYAEELLYQDFRIKLPFFVNDDHKRIYLKVLHHYRQDWLRGRVIDDHGYFLNQRGQNLLYSNVVFTGSPMPGVWGQAACMAYGADKHVSSFRPWGGSDTAPAVIFVATPDDYSFQHFSDRVAVMLAQTKHLSTNIGGGWKYIGTPNGHAPIVRELWQMLVPGFTSESLLHASDYSRIETQLLLYPCQAPLIHPYQHQLTSELIKQAAGFDAQVVVPITSRPVVLFFNRQGSRKWDNQEECRITIQQLIVERNRGEELVTFETAAYPTPRDVVALGQRVKLMVGVHGGALYNLIFMQPGTGLIEVCPVAADEKSFRCGVMFWEMASILSMPYWNIMATQVTAHWQITHLDCGLVVAAVRHALENLETIPSPLEAFHQGSKLNHGSKFRQFRRQSSFPSSEPGYG